MVYTRAFALTYLFEFFGSLLCLYILLYVYISVLWLVFSPKFFLKWISSFEPLRYSIFKVQAPPALSASLFIIHRRKPFVNTFFQLFSVFFVPLSLLCFRSSGSRRATYAILPPFPPLVNYFLSLFSLFFSLSPFCTIPYLFFLLPIGYFALLLCSLKVSVNIWLPSFLELSVR